jgi:hypothetical protein
MLLVSSGRVETLEHMSISDERFPMKSALMILKSIAWSRLCRTDAQSTVTHPLKLSHLRPGSSHFIWVGEFIVANAVGQEPAVARVLLSRIAVPQW